MKKYCLQCGKPINIEADHVGIDFDCPYCGAEMWLDGDTLKNKANKPPPVYLRHIVAFRSQTAPIKAAIVVSCLFVVLVAAGLIAVVRTVCQLA